MLTLLVLSMAAFAKAPETIPLWPEGAPGAKGSEEADVPTLTFYYPEEDQKTGASIVVCPGGGYAGLASYEGKDVAEWLATLGITGVVLKYRHSPGYRHPAPLQDAARAVRTLRAGAEEYGLDPDRIGICGFSAGGHLASTLATHFEAGDPNAKDPIEQVSSRPDVAILCYPVISMTADFTHTGSRKNLLGENPSQELMESLSSEKQVTEETPPTFIFHTAEDQGVHSHNALMMAKALREHGVEHELHLYQKGRHGVGLATDDPVLRTWTGVLANWLGVQGFLNKGE
jgi:acetyl esterase/lipase